LDRLTVPALVRNEVLRRLPRREWDRISKDIRPVHIPQGFLAYSPDDPIDWIYFPQTAVFSALRLMRDGAVAEISMIGPEGLTGWRVLLEKAVASARTVCSMPGEALAMDAEVFLEHVEASPALRSASLAYVSRYMTMLSLLIACNRLHRVEQRCARWLLMTGDRVGDAPFLLTQERLSAMLGSQRPTLTTAIASLREAGCVGGGRGVIEILDRAKLKSFACECYDVCAQLFCDGENAAPAMNGRANASIA
jgi:CRP-like cAMP-binding protein